MTKQSDTRLFILKTGLEMASRLGLECVTIGTLAGETAMSKSGLFAHFQSKENLQIAILQYAEAEFVQDVLVPAVKIKAGIPRIRRLVNDWIAWGERLTGGCIFVTAGTEYSDRPGKVRDVLLKQQQTWIGSLRRMAESAITAGHFRKGIDSGQFAFELYALLLGFHYYHKLLRDSDSKKRQKKALSDLLDRYKTEKTG